MNPMIAFWTRRIRQRIGVQRQWVDLIGRELKALEDALMMPGARQRSFGRRGLWGLRPWGQGLWGTSDVASPYDTVEASADVEDAPIDVTPEPGGPTDEDDTTDVTPGTPEGGRRLPPNSALFAVFRTFDKKHRHDEDYFTEDLYPHVRKVNEELEARGYGASKGYDRFRRDELQMLYDRYVHHEAQQEMEEKEEQEDEEEHEAPTKSPSDQDLVKVFKQLYAADMELTRTPPHVPYEEDVTRYLARAGFKPVKAERIAEVFESADSGSLAEKWRAQEREEGDWEPEGERRPTIKQIKEVFTEMRSDLRRHGELNLTRRGRYPIEDVVNRKLAAKNLQPIVAPRIKELFDSPSFRELRDGWRKEFANALK